MTKLSLESVVLTMLVNTKCVAFAFRKLNYNPFINQMTNASEHADAFRQLLLPVHRMTPVTSVLQTSKVIKRLVDLLNRTSFSSYISSYRVKMDRFELKRTGLDEKSITNRYRIDQTVLC